MGRLLNGLPTGLHGMELEFDIKQNGCHAIGAFTDALEHAHAWEQALANVSEYRANKARAFRFEQDRRLCLLAGVLLDNLLQAHGLKERDMVYRENEFGKPLFAQYPELHFSVAHSGNMAVAALSQAPVGIDVEYLPGFPRDIADPNTWTEMEAVGKAIGHGVGEYVDGASYQRPKGFEVHRICVDDYLICLAQQVQ